MPTRIYCEVFVIFYLWKSNSIGKIWLDSDQLKDIISQILPSEYYCREVSFEGESSTFAVHIAISEDIPTENREVYENLISDKFNDAGIKIEFYWIKVLPEDNPNKNPIWTMPLFWSAVIALLMALIHLGVKGILYTLSAAVLGYIASWLVLTDDGKKILSDLLKKIRR